MSTSSTTSCCGERRHSRGERRTRTLRSAQTLGSVCSSAAAAPRPVVPVAAARLPGSHRRPAAPRTRPPAAAGWRPAAVGGSARRAPRASPRPRPRAAPSSAAPSCAPYRQTPTAA
eukprot:3293129-Prymnesium_polylepis.1